MTRTLDALGVDRIDHGVRAAEDPALVTRLAAERIPLTVCPLSNVKLKVIPSLEASSLRTLLDAGVAVTINSDDPAYFGGYIGENFTECARAFTLTRHELRALGVNAIAGSFASDARKSELLGELEVAFSVT